ncbi:thioredoxin-like protein [Multifurca ochricompacta]|uniref:Large ribosomal subunit protein mL43 n=1 Tax=Multifurca ochricompacta TaxID=376703 RepID=A0AAD4QQ20_9AGAM|nr:thioredoxin-like protein [Multifurca ochricompacta]
MLASVTKPIFRAQLSSKQSNGHFAFVPQIRKLVFEYSQNWPSSTNTRTYLRNNLQNLARANPHVEVVVRQRNNRQPIIRGFYLNNNEKVIPLNGFEVTGIEKKVQLLLDSSGAKIKSLKRRTVESATESARGIWSGLHDIPFQI